MINIVDEIASGIVAGISVVVITSIVTQIYNKIDSKRIERNRIFLLDILEKNRNNGTGNNITKYQGDYDDAKYLIELSLDLKFTANNERKTLKTVFNSKDHG